ncbi:MAG: response regulator [Polyangiaceae bacterium]
MSDARSVLVVDDDDTFRTRLVRALAQRGFDAQGAPSVAEAKVRAEADSPEYAVVDLKMPDASGLDTVKTLLSIDPTTRVVVLTGYGSIATAVEAIKLGAVDYLTKPADVDQILAALARTTEGGDAPSGSFALGEVPSLARVEWEHIQRVLSDAGGNITVAAKVLGIHRRSLQRKLGKNPVRR